MKQRVVIPDARMFHNCIWIWLLLFHTMVSLRPVFLCLCKTSIGYLCGKKMRKAKKLLTNKRVTGAPLGYGIVCSNSLIIT